MIEPNKQFYIYIYISTVYNGETNVESLNGLTLVCSNRIHAMGFLAQENNWFNICVQQGIDKHNIILKRYTNDVRLKRGVSIPF